MRGSGSASVRLLFCADAFFFFYVWFCRRQYFLLFSVSNPICCKENYLDKWKYCWYTSFSLPFSFFCRVFIFITFSHMERVCSSRCLPCQQLRGSQYSFSSPFLFQNWGLGDVSLCTLRSLTRAFTLTVSSSSSRTQHPALLEVLFTIYPPPPFWSFLSISSCP